MNVRPKPWWLFWQDPNTWVTLAGTIYHPKKLDPSKYPWILAHEQIHVQQQEEDGWLRFLWAYLTLRRARMEYEAEAFAAERPFWSREEWLTARASFAADLTGWHYVYAARNQREALDVIDFYAGIP